MKFICTLVILLVVGANAEYKFTDCGNDQSAIKFHNFMVGPDPLVFDWVTHATVTADIEVKKDLTDDFEIQIGIKRKGRIIRIPIPIHLKKTVCQAITGSTKKAACDFLTAAGVPCKCPVKPGRYHLSNQPVKVDLKKYKIRGLSTLLKFGSGKYEVSITVNNKKNKHDKSCAKINMQAKMRMK